MRTISIVNWLVVGLLDIETLFLNLFSIVNVDYTYINNPCYIVLLLLNVSMYSILSTIKYQNLLLLN